MKKRFREIVDVAQLVWEHVRYWLLSTIYVLTRGRWCVVSVSVVEKLADDFLENCNRLLVLDSRNAAIHKYTQISNLTRVGNGIFPRKAVPKRLTWSYVFKIYEVYRHDDEQVIVNGLISRSSCDIETEGTPFRVSFIGVEGELQVVSKKYADIISKAVNSFRSSDKLSAEDRIFTLDREGYPSEI